MLALIERLTDGMAEYAPAHMRPASKCLFRIYRDTRFSADKSPYKTHLGAWWARSGLEKTSGGGYYMHVGADRICDRSGRLYAGEEATAGDPAAFAGAPCGVEELIEDRKLLRRFQSA